MFGTEVLVTCGDLTLLPRKSGYNESDAASEVSWVIVFERKRTHSMKNLSPEYVVGLVDGEGSFTVYVRNPDVKSFVIRRVMVEPKFYVKLIERDKEILFALQRFFGCGSVYFQKDTRSNHQNCYRYEVFRWENLQTKIIPFFKQNKLKFASKQHDFEIFCVMMEILSKREHLTDKGLRQLFKLKRQMH